MKIERLIGILSILLQKHTVTAPYLAEHFEVSRRTIHRDIEDLCKAGIPVYTRQGQGGGISIMEEYKIERTLLTGGEMQDILAGLRSLDSINGTKRYEQLMEKLSVGSSDIMEGNQSILIDLSSWYKNSLAPKIEIIRNAMDTSIELTFTYYSPKGESIRVIEPYFLIFRWSSWYVWGWCKKSGDYRLFKLNRMDQVRGNQICFQKRKVPLPDLKNERIFPGGIVVKALFDPECKWRLVEEFGIDSFEVREDGSLFFQADYTDKENLLTWLLSFRDKVELIEPEEIRKELCDSIEKMREKYVRPQKRAERSKMSFDFKKEYKEFYMPKSTPMIVDVPKANYIGVRGQGNPNEEGGDYQKAIGILYGLAYTLKMSYKADYSMDGFFDYVVPPLEGFWWQKNTAGFNYKNKEDFHWISVIRIPEFVKEKDFNWAISEVARKKDLDCKIAEFLTIEEGKCVQIMHTGSFDNEPATVALMDKYLVEQGYENDFSEERFHHEIYLSDARRVPPEKWKTVIRHPIKFCSKPL